MKKVMWIVLGGLILHGAAQAASFDCSKAQSKVEKLICADAELSKLDEEMTASYADALKGSATAADVRNAQKQWLKIRDTCQDSQCLKNTYRQQVTSLRSPVLAPFQFFQDETLPEQRKTPVCNDFRNYLNHPRTNALFSPDGKLIRETDLFKSVSWETLSKETYRAAFIAYLEVIRPGALNSSNGMDSRLVRQLLRQYDSPQWAFQRTMAYPFEFVPKPDQKQRWLFRLVNQQPYTRDMKDPNSEVELPTWFNFGEEAFLGYEDGSPLENNRYGLTRTGTRQWIVYAGKTYSVNNATYGDGKGVTPDYLGVDVDQLRLSLSGESFMSFECAFRAKNRQ